MIIHYGQQGDSHHAAHNYLTTFVIAGLHAVAVVAPVGGGPVSTPVARAARYKRTIDFSDGGEARFFEDPATGEFYIAVKAPVGVDANGALILRIAIPTVVTTTYAVLDRDRAVLVDDDAAGGAVTVTLPPAVDNLNRELVIKKLGTTGSVTIDGNEAETIDGALTKVLLTQYDVVELESDGANWWII